MSATLFASVRLATHGIGIGFRNTLCDHLGVALLVASIPAVLALISFSGKQKLLAQSAENGLVELSLNEFMSVHLEHVASPLSYGALTTETSDLIERPLLDVLLDCNACTPLSLAESGSLLTITHRNQGAMPPHQQVRPQTTHRYLQRSCSGVRFLQAWSLPGAEKNRRYSKALQSALEW